MTQLHKDVEALTAAILSSVPYGSTIRVTFIPAAPRVQQRVSSAQSSQLLIEQARAIRSAEGIPFWHALFIAGELDSEGVPPAIIRSALFHQDPTQNKTLQFVVNKRTPIELADLAFRAEVHGRDTIALQSRVTTASGRERYLPMLDFTSKATRPGSEATVRVAAEALDTAGILCSSARSFHFYGRDLVTREEQLDFWARALLLTPIVDERWIAHQIRSQVGALRFSANERGFVPRVVREIVRGQDREERP
ncbi:hypothetical protein [Serinibacter salmoneus]|uniref:Uncharacterized protein n=1 Tax=Serinibacter salmoneus TaxID=556530 RepID=A0A2A9D2U3_9MICO|nr:hypothetical protein [Serinibacter salmoneus]PFG20701.1 hypothetical protein ATL40_2311 [Serinibacter salmoneus]